MRTVRGNRGAKSYGKTASLTRENKPAGWNIPDGIEQVLPCKRFTQPGKWLLVTDVHVPFQDSKKLAKVLDIGIDEGCEHFISNGDFYDFHQISKYERDLTSLNVLDELRVGEPILEQIANRFEGKKVFNVGNHDARYERHLMNAVPELARSSRLRLAEFIGLNAMGFEVIASTQQMEVGNQLIYHGHELGFGGGNPSLFARNVFRFLQRSLVVGHFHQSCSHTETLGQDPRKLTVEFVGHLGMKQNYRPVTNQTTGFAILTVHKDGTTSVENRQI